MNKKSYKMLQNRLYREIKRRIRAEQIISLRKNVGIIRNPNRIECIGIQQILPSYPIERSTEIAKAAIIEGLATKLYEEGFVTFRTEKMYNNYSFGPSELIKARVYVMKPYD